MFHIRLKEKRIEAKRTQKELAEYLNITPQSVSKWEKGEALPSLEYLPKIAAFLQCDINSFFVEGTTATVENNKCITELVFILDKSGSMAGMETDTIGGFNAMIEKQKMLEEEALVSTVLFSNHPKLLHDRVPIDQVSAMSRDDYRAGGGTALFDAIGHTIRRIKAAQEEFLLTDTKEKVKFQTIFVITTDGIENASRDFRGSRIKAMIRKMQEAYGWEFLFMAANIDAMEAADHLGIRPDRTTSYNVRESTGTLFHETASTLSEFRTTGRIREDWAKKLEEENSPKK